MRPNALVLGLLAILLVAGPTPAEAANTGTTEIEVEIALLDHTGAPATPYPPLVHTIQPGKVQGNSIADDTGGPVLYCRFDVLKGNRSALRASYCVFPAVGNNSCLVTGDAR